MQALVDSSIFLRSDCGGKGSCGKCSITLVEPNGDKTTTTSCNLEVNGDTTIEIPEASLLSSHIISKAPVSFPDSFSRTQSQTEEKQELGIAVDLGTTTIAVYLCNRNTREVLSSVAVKNPQAMYGDDVMSRIGAIGEDPENLSHLQRLVVNGIDWGVKELTRPKSVEKDRITQMVVVGNPAMIHIFSGVDPKPIGLSPYQPAFHEARETDALELGFKLPGVRVKTLPNISGFIGGDILAAALATDLENRPDGTLLIDLGTNGELLYKADGKLFATSCATGPAFEGASLSCGMQAIPGAINSIHIEDKTCPAAFTTIQSKKKKAKPMGICGTGAISGVAELCRNEIIAPGGAFNRDQSVGPLTKDAEDKYIYCLVQEEDGSTPTVYISQKDIRSVQLGKGALITGIEFLAQAAGDSVPENIVIAGAFGNYIEKDDMVAIGMIPKLPKERIEIAGNSAGAGAIMALCDELIYLQAQKLAAKITTIDLACNVKFQETFVHRLSFPLKN